MSYFGATVESVLARVQNTSIDSDSLGGDTYIETLMAEAERDITGMIPKKISSPLYGEVWGHILVRSANDGQETIDTSQTIPQDSSNWHVFIDYDGCGTPENNKGYEAVLDTDYTIESGVPDFAIKPLSLGSNVIANYNTDWSDNYGLEALRGMLEESVALLLMRNAGIADNPDLISDVDTRKKDLAIAKKRIQLGEMVPAGLQEMNLVVEVEANDDSHFATVSTINRGS